MTDSDVERNAVAEKASPNLVGVSVALLVVTLIVPVIFIVPLILGVILVARDKRVGAGIGVMVASILIFIVRLSMYADSGYQSAF